MEALIILPQMINRYQHYLIQEEKSRATIEKYTRDIKHFYSQLPPDKTVTKEIVVDYKRKLLTTYQVRSANSMLASVNGFLTFLGWSSYRVKTYKCQRTLVTDTDHELKRAEYQQLLETAGRRGASRIYHIIQTICATGIRISELQFITVEALKGGQAQVNMKGKNRIVVIEKKLRQELLRYCRSRGIRSGSVFITRTGRPVDRSNIWTEMKKLSEKAAINKKKVHPHNLRHLFARTFYKKYKDIVYLADILGHSNINTTRIYTSVTSQEHEKVLANLNLLY